MGKDWVGGDRSWGGRGRSARKVSMGELVG